MEAIDTNLIIIGVGMNTLFLIKVNILVSINGHIDPPNYRILSTLSKLHSFLDTFFLSIRSWSLTQPHTTQIHVSNYDQSILHRVIQTKINPPIKIPTVYTKYIPPSQNIHIQFMGVIDLLAYESCCLGVLDLYLRPVVD